METKVCTKCGVEKPIEQFSWKVKMRGVRQNHCKLCAREYSRQYRLENPDKRKEQMRRWRKKNKEKKREDNRRWAAENPDKVSTNKRRWYLKHKDELREKRRLRRQRYLKNNKEFAIHYRLNQRMRRNINRSLKGRKNGYSWEYLVGYTLDQLISHLEVQFKPGMTWDNYGEWHIDHIRPIASFNFTKPDDPEFRECWALENLQPLWAEENLRKGAKVI